MSRPRLHWTNFLFLVGVHLVGLLAIYYMAAIHFSWWTVGLGFLWSALCGFSISGGYHRLFSHAAYVAAWPLRAFYLAFGAASVQNSAMAWSDDHRTHHAHTDTEQDPYSISRGFWWAHIGWVVCKGDRGRRESTVRDLEADPLVRFQDKHYIVLAAIFGVGLPTLIGMAWGDALGAFLVAGWLRLCIQWHVTFSINSFAHLIGRQPYGKLGSARDSFIVAMLTMGEGYHNFHHRFQTDYRNGIRWFDFDPTKWWVFSASRVGLAKDLRRVPPERILAARIAAKQAVA
jgi:stearoyl-CoA desaturase (delta-9 desaturase)